MSKSDLLPIEDRVGAEIDRVFGGREDLRFLIAVSGGPDSMALWHIFRRLGVDGVVCHVNYQKRGEDSEKDVELVEDMADRWNYDLKMVRVDPENSQNRNFQQWARDTRYRIFRETVENRGLDAIAVAHHRDDQVETILLKMFRGAGLESWQGMQVWDGELFRPLLTVGREDIETYVRGREISYRIDKSNLDSGFARNFLRNEGVDTIENYFPGWKKNILRLSDQSALFGKALEELLDRLIDDRHRIDRQAFLDLDPALRKALVLHYLKGIEPGLTVSREALAQLDDLGEMQTGKEIQISESYSIMRDREWYKIVYDQPDSLIIAKMDREELSGGGFRLNDLLFKVESCRSPDFDERLVMDSGKISWPVTLRYWRDGDRFQPFGMSGHQNVSDHLTNRKVSAAEKEKAMVLESFEERICAVIFPPIEKRVPPGTLSQKVRCDEGTDECLTVEWKEQ